MIEIDFNIQQMQEYWNPTVERCGLILQSGEIKELKNSSPTPHLDFIILADEYAPYAGETVATWHTHPRTSSNLSTQDYLLFQRQPQWLHLIAARDKVRAYFARDNKVFVYENANLPRVPM